MSLESDVSRNGYVGTGLVSDYDYDFKIFDKSHLKVTVRNTVNEESELVLDVDYSVSGVGEDGGGVVSLIDGVGDPEPLPDDYSITIRRVVPLDQLTDIKNQGDFFPEIHEDKFDYLTMIDQQQQDELDRSLKLPETIPSSIFDPTFPASLVGNPGASVIVNDDGDGFKDGPLASEISNAQAYAEAASDSADDAASSESQAASSANAAALSQASAAAVLASAFFRSVVTKVFADSPITIDQTYNGQMVEIDSSGGAIVINLPQISSVTLPFNVAFKLKTAGNTVTINRGGSDLIDGGTSMTLVASGTGLMVTARTGNWTSLSFGTVADGSITTAKIVNGAISVLKLADSALPVNGILNMGYLASVSSNALTIARKQLDGSTNHTSDLPGAVVFRNPTITSGGKTVVKSTGAASITVPSGTTLGTVSGIAEFLQIYEINNAGTMEIGVGVGCSVDESTLQTTLAVSGGTTRGQIYTTTARSNITVRLIGQLKIAEATAGTWATAPSVVSMIPFNTGSRNMIRLNTANGRGSTNTTIPRFLNTNVNYGNAITYADSSTLGATFTINEDGIYAIHFYKGVNTTNNRVQAGISLNSSQLSTPFDVINTADRLASNIFGVSSGANGEVTAGVSWTGFLKAGDVIRAHSNADDPSTAAAVGFTITQVSK